MSSDKTNNLFWLEYGRAIKEQASGDLGPNGVFFLSTEAQKGPPAGDGIPDSYTYQGLYDIGNNLLSADSYSYSPSALNGYTDALRTYLAWVDLEGHNDPVLDIALLNALKAQDADQTNYRTELKKANENFKEESELGLTGKQSFPDWVVAGNAPAYSAAKNQLLAQAATIQQIHSKQNGPLAAALSKDMATLDKGSNDIQDYPGFNMRCALGNVLSPQELVNLYKSGTAAPEPPFQYRPAYNAPNYKASVQTAMRKALNEYDPAQDAEFAIDTSKSTSDFNFGQTVSGADIGVSWGGWFSINSNASHTSESETLDTSDESTSVSIKITFDTIEIVNIVPGSWNVNVSKYKLRDNAPPKLRTLVRPSGLVLATRMGYQITVGAKTANTLDSKLKTATSGGGSVSLFGLPISLGGNVTSEKETKTHVGSWDNASRTFTVKPSSSAGFATIVGVIGEKFDVVK